MSSPLLTRPPTILFALVFLGISSDCKPSRSHAETADLAVEVVDCGAVRRSTAGTVCELGARRSIRIVVPTGTRAPRVRTESGGEMAFDAGVAEHDDGSTITVQVPAEATSVVVDASLGGAPVRARILVAPADPRPWLDEARSARAKGDLATADALATAHASDRDPVSRALSHGLLGRLALARGRADDAFPLLRQAIEEHRSAGRVSDVIDDSFALSFALQQRSQRYTEARAVLDGIVDELASYPEGRARAPYYRGTLAGETGDRRQALALLREAERAARRLGMVRLERNARSALALEFQEMGRVRASLSLLADLEKEYDLAARDGKSDRPSACERAELANNLGWGALLANEGATSEGVPPSEDAGAPLERSLAIDCADAYVRSFALSNLARLALDSGDVARAERALAEAKAKVKEPRGTDRLAWGELEGRIHLARGRRTEALRVLDESLALARASFSRPAEWSLLVARSDVLIASQRSADAVSSLRAAEDLLETAVLLAPLGEGRGTYASSRSRSARMLVGLLFGQGDAAAAATVAKRAHARVLASAAVSFRLERLSPDDRARWEDTVRSFRRARAALDTDAADDWKLPADALARAVRSRAERERELRSALERAMTFVRPSGGERSEERDAGNIELDVFPDLEGFVAIAQRKGEFVIYRVPSPKTLHDADAVANALLEPIAGFIEQGDPDAPLVVRAYGAWRAIDVHALPWRGDALLARRAVVYSTGVGMSAAASTANAVLVVGDPTSDLPVAHDEARSVARRLEGNGHADAAARTVRLLVGDAATSRAVHDGLRDASRFHYAGHGVFAGDEGWDSALPLAANGRLTVPDILALAQAPRSVVLSGCEAAKSTGDAEGLGIAQAFIVAGATEVLAPVRVIPDDLAGKMVGALYDGADTSSLQTSARTSILRLRSATSDWSAFRVLVR